MVSKMKKERHTNAWKMAHNGWDRDRIIRNEPCFMEGMRDAYEKNKEKEK